MKFKYKKIVLLITMSTMFIGMIIFSMLESNTKPSTKVEENEEQKIDEQKGEEQLAEENQEEEEQDVKEAAASPEPEIRGVIQKNLNAEISEVVKLYLETSVSCDMDALEEVVSNISMIDENELKLKYQSVERIENIECYMVEGPDQSGYLVYAYRELKLKNIDTLAPGLSRMYVTRGDSGEYRVFFGADTGLEEFIAATDRSKEVVELVEKVDKKLEEAKSSDAKLKEFIDALTGESN